MNGILINGFPGAGKTALINHINSKNTLGKPVVSQHGDGVCSTGAFPEPGYVITEQTITPAAFVLQGYGNEPTARKSCTRVAVIDCYNFINDFSGIEEDHCLPGPLQTVVGNKEILTWLIKAAQMIVLNKADLINATQLTMIRFIVELINENALVEPCVYGRLSTNGFTFLQHQNAHASKKL